jgi:hypothetical protein
MLKLCLRFLIAEAGKVEDDPEGVCLRSCSDKFSGARSPIFLREERRDGRECEVFVSLDSPLVTATRTSPVPRKETFTQPDLE